MRRQREERHQSSSSPTRKQRDTEDMKDTSIQFHPQLTCRPERSMHLVPADVKLRYINMDFSLSYRIYLLYGNSTYSTSSNHSAASQKKGVDFRLLHPTCKSAAQAAFFQAGSQRRFRAPVCNRASINGRVPSECPRVPRCHVFPKRLQTTNPLPDCHLAVAS